MADHHGQNVMETAKNLCNASGMIKGSGPSGKIDSLLSSGPTQVNVDRRNFPASDPIWHFGFLFSPALTLGGGTFAVQRNIVAERVLGLPRDIDVEEGKTWSEARKQ